MTSANMREVLEKQFCATFNAQTLSCYGRPIVGK